MSFIYPNKLWIVVLKQVGDYHNDAAFFQPTVKMKTCMSIKWNLPLPGCVHINTNRAAHQNSRLTCFGGVLRDANGA